MNDQKKCAHPPCKCLVVDGGSHGKYCSEHCEAADDAAARCRCQHADCRQEPA